jgi:hypothetical protein
VLVRPDFAGRGRRNFVGFRLHTGSRLATHACSSDQASRDTSLAAE